MSQFLKSQVSDPDCVESMSFSHKVRIWAFDFDPNLLQIARWPTKLVRIRGWEILNYQIWVSQSSDQSSWDLQYFATMVLQRCIPCPLFCVRKAQVGIRGRDILSSQEPEKFSIPRSEFLGLRIFCYPRTATLHSLSTFLCEKSSGWDQRLRYSQVSRAW